MPWLSMFLHMRSMDLKMCGGITFHMVCEIAFCKYIKGLQSFVDDKWTPKRNKSELIETSGQEFQSYSLNKPL